VDNTAIDTALHLGLTGCLHQLQASNPSLLLTANELKTVQRDAQYVPACSSAMLAILKNSKNTDASFVARIQRWTHTNEKSEVNSSDPPVSSGRDNETSPWNISALDVLIQHRFRFVVSPADNKQLVNNDKVDSDLDTHEIMNDISNPGGDVLREESPEQDFVTLDEADTCQDDPSLTANAEAVYDVW
jgi:hypothetical protein